jgi:large subunit ribosomal protein L21e
MTTRIGTSRRKTRKKFTKPVKEKGKLSIKAFMQTLEPGDKVVLKAEPAYQKGMYHPRFHGKIGVVCGVQGECYQVELYDGAKPKLLVVHPVHLKKV